MVNEVKFQPIGYIIGQVPGREDVSFVDNQEEWASITKAFKGKAPPSKVDFSQKKVVVVQSSTSCPSEWLIIQKISITASAVLEIECKKLMPRSGMMSIIGLSSATQFISIDKNISSSQSEIVVLNDEASSVIDPELKELEIQLVEVELERLSLLSEECEKYDQDSFYDCKGNKIKPEDITDPNQRDFAERLAEQISRHRKAQTLFDERKAEASNRLRGPELSKF